MNITEELFETIADLTPQIEEKFGVKIGYFHPLGEFSDNDDHFVLYMDGEYNPETEDIDNCSWHIIKNNEFEFDRDGFMVKCNADLEQRSEEIDDILIDINSWITRGDLVVYKLFIFNKFLHWKQLNKTEIDLIMIADDGSKTRCFYVVDELRYPEFKDHVLKNMV